MTMTATTTATVKLAWDEPEAISPRGWLYWQDGHPDRDHHNYRYFRENVRCCGYYLDYSESLDQRVKGKPVLARAYCLRLDGEHALGCEWFATIPEAKAWIEGNVRAYMGLPREEPTCPACGRPWTPKLTAPWVPEGATCACCQQ